MAVVMRGFIFLLLIGFAAADTLTQVCDDKISAAQVLNHIPLVRSLIEQYKSVAGNCVEEYADSFLQLESVLSEDNLKDVCSDKTVNAIESYHKNFIHFYSASLTTAELKEIQSWPQSERTQAVPKALYRFFILFAKHVGVKCRNEIPKRLQNIVDIQKLVSDNDFKMFDVIFAEASLIGGQSIDSLSPPVSGAEMNAAIPEETIIPQIQQLCQAKFQPIYEEILVPVVRLNHLGYSGKQYDSRQGRLALSKPQVARWYQVYQVCEALRSVSLVVIRKNTFKGSKRRHFGSTSQEKVEATQASKAAEPQVEPVELVEIAHEPVELEGILSYYREESDADSAVQQLTSDLDRELNERLSDATEIYESSYMKLLEALGIL